MLTDELFSDCEGLRVAVFTVRRGMYPSRCPHAVSRGPRAST